jgi:CubicO group peptidase (beta-lactamase class C family)
MRVKWLLLALVSIWWAISAVGGRGNAAEPTSLAFDIPRLEGISIDGDPSDWGDRGLRVGPLFGLAGMPKLLNDFDPHFRLGWNDEGLLVLAEVADNVVGEANALTSKWGPNEGDAIEIFYNAKPGIPGYIMVALGTGGDPKQPQVRSYIWDWRQGKDDKSGLALGVSAAGKPTKNGYRTEMLLPWKNLDLTPALNKEIEFQIIFQDSDPGQELFCASWYPVEFRDEHDMYTLRLSERASAPLVMTGSAAYENFHDIKVSLFGAPETVGKTVEVKDDGKPIASGQFMRRADGRAFGRVTLPLPAAGGAYGRLTTAIDGNEMGIIPLSPLGRERIEAIEKLDPGFTPAVFSGQRFPECGFADPQFVADVIGRPYLLDVTYYDRDYNPVTLAEKPGRYGAVVEIIPENGGRPLRRFRTLFRLPDAPINWSSTLSDSKYVLPKELGLNPEVLNEYADVITEQMINRFREGFSQDNEAAILLAGLSEVTPGAAPAKRSDSRLGNGLAGERGYDALSQMVETQDRQWWVGFKQKYYGLERSPKVSLAPHKITGPPAPVLHKGTLSEAGMKPEAAQQIDALCREWAANSKAGFVVCIARHGVMVLHKAYGLRNGKPMTVDIQSDMASTTKFLGATLMWMLIDRGGADLDDPIDKYLPALRGIPVEKPITVRNLYTHTAGLWGHVGDSPPYPWMNDMEEVLADIYPSLEVGKQHEYNGLGYALGAKIVEAKTGKALPRLYRQYLLDPLGCKNTLVLGSYGDAESTAFDIATVAQLALNGGTYGNLRFFDKKTLGKMLPVRLTSLLGPDTEVVWGIGTRPEPQLYGMVVKGLFSPSSYGHGGASGAIMDIDPDNDLLFIMTRDTEDDYNTYMAYKARLLKVISDNLVDKKL